jgi:hypothetical protein
LGVDRENAVLQHEVTVGDVATAQRSAARDAPLTCGVVDGSAAIRRQLAIEFGDREAIVEDLPIPEEEVNDAAGESKCFASQAHLHRVKERRAQGSVLGKELVEVDSTIAGVGIAKSRGQRHRSAKACGEFHPGNARDADVPLQAGQDSAGCGDGRGRIDIEPDGVDAEADEVVPAVLDLRGERQGERERNGPEGYGRRGDRDGKARRIGIAAAGFEAYEVNDFAVDQVQDSLGRDVDLEFAESNPAERRKPEDFSESPVDYGKLAGHVGTAEEVERARDLPVASFQKVLDDADVGLIKVNACE